MILSLSTLRVSRRVYRGNADEVHSPTTISGSYVDKIVFGESFLEPTISPAQRYIPLSDVIFDNVLFLKMSVAINAVRAGLEPVTLYFWLTIFLFSSILNIFFFSSYLVILHFFSNYLIPHFLPVAVLIF